LKPAIDRIDAAVVLYSHRSTSFADGLLIHTNPS
jgi:hypothetical protein